MTETNSVEQDRLAAARLGGQSHFLDVRLVASSVTMDRFPDPTKSLTYKLTVQPTIEHGDGETQFVIRARYVVEIVQLQDGDADVDGDGESDALASLDFEYAGLFDMPSATEQPLTTNEIEAFGRTTGSFALYPFAREYVFSTTSKMGLPALTLDLLKLELPKPTD